MEREIFINAVQLFEIDGSANIPTVIETYSKDSTATLKNKYYDPYIRFFRWAVDRLAGRPGIVCYVSNHKFVDTLDGMQKHLLRDFTRIWRSRRRHAEPLSHRVTDKVNSSLTLAGIPKEAFGYVLGTRSALEWVVDQYRTETDPHTGITSEPNDPADEQFIVRLIERVTTVSLSTVTLVKQLPASAEFVGFSSDDERRLARISSEDHMR